MFVDTLNFACSISIAAIVHYLISHIFFYSHNLTYTMFSLRVLHTVVILCTAIAFVVGFSACQPANSPQTKAPLVVAASYDTSAFATNAAAERALQANLRAFTVEMQNGRPGAASATNRNLPVSAARLRELFAAMPSLAESTTPYYRDLVTRQGGWIDQLAGASGKDGDLLATPPTEGRFGGTSGYLFLANGLEPEQPLEKGLFGAAMFNRILPLLSAPLTLANLDKIVALYGAPPNFPNGRPAAGAANDVAIAQYAARRDNSGGGPGGNTGAKGLYTLTRDAFIKAQSALKAGADYKPELDSAVAELQGNMERTIGATCINYCHSALAALSATNPTPAQVAAALHALGENVGFIGGLKTLPRKIITDAQIDAILANLNAPHPAAGGQVAMLRFLNNPTELAKLTTIINDVARIYGFTPAQVELFKRNNLSDRPQ
jgi:hypothetical protein